MYTAFDGADGLESDQHLVQMMLLVPFNADLSLRDFERCGMYYDQFRAWHWLPVFPKEIDIFNCDEEHLFRSLRFSRDIANSPVNANAICCGDDEPAWTPLLSDEYMLPAVGSGSCVNRACVATANTGAQCLVIYRSICSQSDVKALNTAASQIKARLPPDWYLLIVVHVFNFADGVAAGGFDYPCVIVRRSDFRKFYGPSLAAPLEYLAYRLMRRPGLGLEGIV